MNNTGDWKILILLFHSRHKEEEEEEEKRREEGEIGGAERNHVLMRSAVAIVEYQNVSLYQLTKL